jgi:conjugal transfer ATP-binding protein TraC
MSLLDELSKAQYEVAPKLSSLLPYRVFDEESALYVNDDSYGFILEVTPLRGASRDTVNILNGMFTNAVPEGCAIQVMNLASPKIGAALETWRRARDSSPDVYKKLADKRVEHYQGKSWKSFFKNPFLLRDFRIFISASIHTRYGSKGKKALLSFREQLEATLQSSGMDSTLIHPEAFIGLLEELVVPSKDINPPHRKWHKQESIKQHISNLEQIVKVSPEGLTFEKIGEEPIEVRSFTVREFPEYWAQWLNTDLLGDAYSDFLRIPCPFMTVCSFIYGQEEKERSKANLKSLRALQKAGSGIARFMPSVHVEAKEWQYVAEKLKENKKLVKTFYQVLLYADTEEMDACEQSLRSLYRSKGWELARDPAVQLQSWLAAMPFTISDGLGDDLQKCDRLKTTLTESCANLAPLQGEWKGMGKPRMMCVSKLGQIFFFDPFGNKSGGFNCAIAGATGSGKSVAMQEFVTCLLGAGGQVIVIDDGRSFMNSCIMLGGSFVEFSSQSNICLNPFSIVSEDAFELKPDYREEVAQLLNLILRQMCRATGATSDIENALIGEAVAFVWNKHRGKATVTNVADFLLKHEDSRAKDLGLMLRPFTASGIYARFFEGEANLSLDTSYFAFEFDRLRSKPDLQRIVLMALVFLVTEKMFHGDRSRTTSLVIDEGWSFLVGEQFKDFIDGISRRARKYEGQLIVGTQSIDDFYKNPAATAVIQNSEWIILLSQSKESIEALKKSGRILMDPGMEKALVNLRTVRNQYSEMLIYGQSIGWVVARLILDPYSVALYSSKGSDFAKIKSMQENGHSLEEALESVALDISKESV